MAQARTAKITRSAPAALFARRLAGLRAQLGQDPGDTGDQALKLVEEFLEFQARDTGYDGDGSMRRYAQWLRGRDQISAELLQRVEAYTDARNALAHTYGLMTTPAFATEIVAFAGELLRQQSSGAQQVMTQQVRSVRQSDRASAARDMMLRDGFGRLPVLDNASRCVGLLTERDLIASHADDASVADMLPARPLDRVAFAAPSAPLNTLRSLLSPEPVLVCMITAAAKPGGRVLGIVTHADLLVRL